MPPFPGWPFADLNLSARSGRRRFCWAGINPRHWPSHNGRPAPLAKSALFSLLKWNTYCVSCTINSSVLNDILHVFLQLSNLKAIENMYENLHQYQTISIKLTYRHRGIDFTHSHGRCKAWEWNIPSFVTRPCPDAWTLFQLMCQSFSLAE